MSRNYDETYLDGLIAKAKKSWEGVDVERYMSDLRDDSFDKEVAENLSKEVASYITEQMKSNMKTIEERAKEWGEHIVETTPYDVVNGKACVFVEDRNIADVAEEAYIAGATEQKAIDDEAMLKGFTTDELRAELKRRNAEERAKKESVLRCRMCRHWGAIDYWGNPLNSDFRDTRSCKFFKTKNGKNYRCHNASQLACEHFERKEE